MCGPDVKSRSSYGVGCAVQQIHGTRTVEGARGRRYGAPSRVRRYGGRRIQTRKSMAQITENTLRQQITECTRMMVMAELLDYSGHVSARIPGTDRRSEEHTSELQSLRHLVCRLLLEKKNQ